MFPTVTTTYTLSVVSSLGGSPVTATVTVTVKTFTGKFVYVANSGGGISGFSLNDANGVLSELTNSPFDPTVNALHVSSDPQGKFLFVVNGDGVVNVNTLTVYAINQATGDLTGAIAYPTGTDPWTAAVDPSGQFVYVRCDGSISAFSLNGSTGALTPLAVPSVTTSGGSGEVLVHPSGKWLFTVGRTSSKLEVFALDPATGAITANSSTSLPDVPPINPGDPNLPAGPLSLALSRGGEYLFTKSEGTSGAVAQECLVYGFHVDVASGGLTALAPLDTGLANSVAYHGVSANPTQSVIYLTLVNSTNDYVTYALDLTSGLLTPLSGATLDPLSAAESDCFTVSRNGKWGFITDYTRSRIAVGAVDPATGILTKASITFVPVELFPVSITVVGTVQ